MPASRPSEQRLADIQKAEKRNQFGSTYVVDAVSGRKTKRVLEETPVRNALTTIVLLLLFSALAFFVWLATMPLLGAIAARLVPGDGVAVFLFKFVVYS